MKMLGYSGGSMRTYLLAEGSLAVRRIILCGVRGEWTTTTSRATSPLLTRMIKRSCRYLAVSSLLIGGSFPGKRVHTSCQSLYYSVSLRDRPLAGDLLFWIGMRS